jgi:hypothetical protein
VVVVVGETATEPDVFTVPIPGEMLTEVAFCVVQIRVVVDPAVMLAGLA